MRAIILPGNNDTRITSNWYLWAKEKLEDMGLDVIARDMPDPVVASRSVWVPFIAEHASWPEDTILIGHSSGATAIMRYLEEGRCALAILVGGCYTDLGDDLEKQSGYYDDPWRWERMREHAQRIVIFASTDDPYIDVSEPRFMHGKLRGTYHEYTDRQHFDEETFPELIDVVRDFLNG